MPCCAAACARQQNESVSPTGRQKQPDSPCHESEGVLPRCQHICSVVALEKLLGREESQIQPGVDRERPRRGVPGLPSESRSGEVCPGRDFSEGVFPNWVIRIEPAASQGSWNQARAIQCGPLGPSGEQGPTPLLYRAARGCRLNLWPTANLTRTPHFGAAPPLGFPLCVPRPSDSFSSPFSQTHRLASPHSDRHRVDTIHTQHAAHSTQVPTSPALGSLPLRLFPT